MGLIWPIAVTGWAIAEATFFFIVPDVLITIAAIRFGARAGIHLALIAAIAAAGSGLLMWLWGHMDADAARKAVLMVPAIGPDLLARAHREIAGAWFGHLVLGAVTGVPYKLYAVEAGARGLNPFVFAAGSAAARFTRFLITVGLTVAMRSLLSRWNRPKWSYRALGAAWFAVYAVYFSLRAMA